MEACVEGGIIEHLTWYTACHIDEPTQIRWALHDD